MLEKGKRFKIIDISQELLGGNVYPSDTAPFLEEKRSFQKDGYRLSDLVLCLHNATHADAPKHTLKEGEPMDRLDLDIFFGECEVCSTMPESRLMCKRILFKDNVPGVEAAKRLSDGGVRLVGIGCDSPDEENSLEIHKILAEAGIVLLENLVLSSVREGRYLICAFPLKIRGAEASPLRAVLLTENTD